MAGGHVQYEAVLAECSHCPAASTHPEKKDYTSSALKGSTDIPPSPFPHGFGGHPSLWLRRKIKCLISPQKLSPTFKDCVSLG